MHDASIGTMGSQGTLALKPGPAWPSFEQFRLAGATALAPIGSGVIGTLATRSGRYRIVEEQDFQRLVGLAADVERLRGGLQLVASAVQAVQLHPDGPTIETLIRAVNVVGELPSLPTREQFSAIAPEGFDLDPDDEVSLDPGELTESPALENPA